jgi:hypothetical protein
LKLLKFVDPKLKLVESKGVEGKPVEPEVPLPNPKEFLSGTVFNIFTLFNALVSVIPVQ